MGNTKAREGTALLREITKGVEQRTWNLAEHQLQRTEKEEEPTKDTVKE